MDSKALRLLKSVAVIMHRMLSREYRAYMDILESPYCERVDWKSGIGKSIHALFGIVRSLRPQTIVEIGSARGRSTCAMALACRMNGKGRVYAIDPHDGNAWADRGTEKDSLEFLRNRISDYGLGKYCEIIPTSSKAASSHWNRPIDFLFIDGDHTYEGVLSDLSLFKHWLTQRALVAFHDSLWDYLRDDPCFRPDMGVPRFLENLRHQGFQMITIWAMPGLTIMHPNADGFPLWPADRSIWAKGYLEAWS